ncbi:ABC transporter substrate-binding protein [Defluviimonas salinarum]|uniref:ABC transporter substrate-binding protein n=1 Tax=Defluviimonas salinarum TaxID=2992147 RepID=A0ABT3J6W6_9RHOB|nr:ABC transporter substrate-binding protein [Defluviimonas salinarum]MCW3783440.1 ABC transporter substrate-binding protein [Defluviimonas salinarum]
MKELCRRIVVGLGAALILPVAAAASDYTVFIATWRGCEEACQGFQDYLTEAGIDVAFVLRDAKTEAAALPAIFEEARSLDPDLIVSWGTTVTREIAGTLDDLDDPAFNHDIPQIFMIVADPVGSGIVASLDATGRPNLTGTYNRMPETVALETIRGYLPDFDHLGLLYNTDEKNSVLKRDELEALTRELGIGFTALEIAAGADNAPMAEDLAPKMAELKAAGVDFVHVGSSSFLRDNSALLRKAALEQALPVLSPYEAMVVSGDALVSVASRYYEVGRLAGAQAERILVEGVTPGDLPVARMTNFAVTINLGMAKQLKLYPPIGLLQIAETVN